MPSVLEVQVTAKLNGRLLPNFPQYRRVQVDEVQQFSVEQATGGGYQTIQSTQVGTVQALLLNPSTIVTVRFNGQSDGGLVLNAGSLLLVLDALLANVSSSNNVTVDNSSGSLALLVGLVGGT